MATTTIQRVPSKVKSKTVVPTVRAAPVPRLMRARIETLLPENYAFMDSPSFKERGIEKVLFGENHEPVLPLTSWYAPTRDEAVEGSTSSPTLMKPAEEKTMFLRFNYSKCKLSKLKAKIEKDGLTKELGAEFLEWHRKFEHFREYLTRTNLALVLAMAKRTRLGDVDFAEVVSEGNMAPAAGRGQVQRRAWV